MILTKALLLVAGLAFANDPLHDKNEGPLSETRPPAETAQAQTQPETVVQSITEVSDLLQGRKRKAVGERSIPYDYEYFPGQIRP